VRHGLQLCATPIQRRARSRPARTLVDRNDVAGRDLLLGQLVNHLLAEVVDGLHVGRLHRQLACLGALQGARARAQAA
jgi:hypothetical protein